MKSKEASGYRNNVKVCHQNFNLWKFQVPSNLIIFSAKGNKGQFEVSRVVKVQMSQVKVTGVSQSQQVASNKDNIWWKMT